MRRLMVILLLGLLLVACSETPQDITGPDQADMSIDSLLGVIDTLRIQLGCNRCLVHCLQDTLDSLGVAPRCECGI